MGGEVRGEGGLVGWGVEDLHSFPGQLVLVALQLGLGLSVGLLELALLLVDHFLTLLNSTNDRPPWSGPGFTTRVGGSEWVERHTG